MTVGKRMTGASGTPCFGCPMMEGGCHGTGSCRMYIDWAASERAQKAESRKQKKRNDVNERLNTLEEENRSLRRRLNMLSNDLDETTDRAQRAYYIARRNDY